MLAISNGFYIYGTYVIALATIVAFTARMMLQARTMSDQIDDDDKYWT